MYYKFYRIQNSVKTTVNLFLFALDFFYFAVLNYFGSYTSKITNESTIILFA